MLVLGRREQQEVVIDLTAFGLGVINVLVTQIRKPNRHQPFPSVRLGFEADKRIRIYRSEIMDREKTA